MSVGFRATARAVGSGVLAVLAASLTVAAGGGAGCSSGASDTEPAGSGGATSGTTTTTASTTGPGGAGGTGGSGAEGGAGGGTGGGSSGCTSTDDCAGDPGGEVCDLATGDCVECVPAADDCPVGQFCTFQNECQVGCTDDGDCSDETVCDEGTNKCVGCDDDADCPDGSICSGETCIPGCSGKKPCEAGHSCCGTVCYDLSKDPTHCGDCNTVCKEPPHATAVCKSGLCSMGECAAPHADCNGDEKDGCEHNTLEDGPCLCTPGDTKTCYDGDPALLGVGACKQGTSTCEPSGVAFGPCDGQVLPAAEKCNGIDDDCDGAPEAPGCVDCTPNTGSCKGEVGTWCKDDGLGYVTEVCDALQGTTCNPKTGKCDGPCGLSALSTSYIGCDYYPTVTANLVATQFSFAVAVSNTGASPAEITITQGAAAVASATVPPGNVEIIPLPWVSKLKGPASNNVVPFPASVRVDDGAYRLRSNQPVTVYQFNPLEYKIGNLFSYSNDASILLPVNAWTGTYRVAARHHFGGGSGFFAVTAKDDGTTVKVTPGPGGGSVKSGIPGIGVNGAGTVVLNAGDVIEVVTNGGVAQNDPNDVTGTLVEADKPVQVIGGHQCIYIPYNVGYCDHIEETMFPYETLSTEYIVTAPLIPTGGANAKVEFVRIVATKPNTGLVYDPPQAGAPAAIPQAGGWIELQNNDQDFQVTADEPVLVVQYMEGQDAGGASGDPSMSVAVAKDQYRTSYLFHAPTNYDYSYVNVVAPLKAKVELDGKAIGALMPIGNTGFGVARETLSNGGTGNHQIKGDLPFGISVYGYGQYTSYWYPGGSNLVKLHD